MSTPPVSISRKRLPDHSQTSSLRSRVVPCVSCTTAARELVSRLTSVDFPTFGKPTIATVPASSCVLTPHPQPFAKRRNAIATDHPQQRRASALRLENHSPNDVS